MALCFKLCAVDNGIVHLIILIWVLCKDTLNHINNVFSMQDKIRHNYLQIASWDLHSFLESQSRSENESFQAVL